jgi:hypothetical protein
VCVCVYVYTCMHVCVCVSVCVCVYRYIMTSLKNTVKHVRACFARFRYRETGEGMKKQKRKGAEWEARGRMGANQLASVFCFV